MKKCIRCGIEKSLDEFSVRHSSVTGKMVHRGYCKSCEVYKTLADNREVSLEKKRAYKRTQTLKQYDITEAEVTRMGDHQSWLCYICKSDIFVKPHIDHDHITGKVRKLLCFHCNVGLGHFYDSIDLLQKAVLYLGENDAQTV